MSNTYCKGVCENYETVDDLYLCKWIGLGHQCNFSIEASKTVKNRIENKKKEKKDDRRIGR